MIHILGYEKIHEFKVFDLVKKYLEKYFDKDVDIYLGAFFAEILGIDLKNKFIYNMEYLHDHSPLWNMGYKKILENNIVLDFSRSNVEYLSKIGIKAEYLPYGINEDLMNNLQKNDKDIDVLFIGTTHFDRRKKILDNLSNECNLVIAKNAYGKELDFLVSKAKVHLNMHHAEGQPLETVRINYLLSNKCTVISEYGSDKDLNEVYKDSLTFSLYDELVDKCLFALDNYDSRKEVFIPKQLFENPISYLRGN